MKSYSYYGPYLICIIVVFFLLTFISCGSKDNGIDNPIIKEIKRISFPIYPGAKNKKEFSLKNGYIQGVSYEAVSRYPAEDILAYYEKELENLGFRSSSGGQYQSSDRKWQTFVDSTRNGEPYVAQLTADWIDQQKTKSAKLILRYSWSNGNKLSRVVLTDNQNLNIVFQMTPYFVLPHPKSIGSMGAGSTGSNGDSH